MTFSFGQSERERIDVEVFGYERQPAGEYWDDNWLTVEIRVQAGGFMAEPELHSLRMTWSVLLRSFVRSTIC